MKFCWADIYDNNHPVYVCSAHWGMFGVLGVFSTSGDTMSTLGDMMSTSEGIMNTLRDIISTSGMFSTS